MEDNIKENRRKNTYKENINAFISFDFSIIFIYVIGFIISKIVPNNLNIKYITQYYIIPVSEFVAENSERLQYIVLTILFPIIYISIYKILQKLNIDIKEHKIAIRILEILNVVLIIGIFLWIANDKLNLYLSIDIIKNTIIGMILISLYNKNKYKKIIRYITFFITSIVILTVSYLYINATFEQNAFAAYHVDAYYYPVLKIMSGLTPFIDFTPIYGCYSYIIAFIQNIFNNNSIYFFSIIEAVTVGIVLVNFAIIINKFIKNKVISCITIVAMIYYMNVFSFVQNRAPYLQYTPHRVLFPSIILLFITIYLKYRNDKNKLILQIIGYIISAFAIFWNIEIGLVVIIVWSGFLIYETLFFNSLKDKKTYMQILKILLMAVGSIVIWFLSIFLITLIRTGEFISIKDTFSSQLMFYKDGYYMLKMKLRDSWIMLICMYLIGLAVSMKKLYFINPERKKIFNNYAMIFVLSILGIGVFSYYQGRSHSEVFTAVLYPGIILTGIYTDILLRRISYSKNKKYMIINIIIVVINISILCYISTKTVRSLIGNKDIKTYLNKETLNSISILDDYTEYDLSNIDFITRYESLYYKKYGINDEKKFSAFIDTFTYDQCEEISKYIKETDKNIILNKKIYNVIINQHGEDFFEEFNIEEKNSDIILIRK